MDVKGRCNLCATVTPKAAMGRHLERCLAAHSVGQGTGDGLFLLRVEGSQAPFYWLDLEAQSVARLSDLDRFLRHIWLECCGHCSAFEIGSTMYTKAFVGSLRRDRQRSLHVTLREALGGVTTWFKYEYDYGSPTYLRLRVRGSRSGVIGRQPVRLLARNEPPVWHCRVCGAPATALCCYCAAERDPLFCDEHSSQHRCGDEALLPVVNSPRIGVCGYTGEG